MIFESKLAGAGGRGWAPGALESAELDAELETKSNHARLPLKGGRRILRASPPAAGPSGDSQLKFQHDRLTAKFCQILKENR